MPFILTKNTSGRRVVWKNALNYVHCIFLYNHSCNHIHTIHSSISVHLGPSPSPHCLGAQREKNIPGVPSRELNLGLHLPTELRHTRICVLTYINLLAFPSQRTYFSSSCKHAAMSLIKTAKVIWFRTKKDYSDGFKRERLIKESHKPENLSVIIMRVLNQYL